MQLPCQIGDAGNLITTAREQGKRASVFCANLPAWRSTIRMAASALCDAQARVSVIEGRFAFSRSAATRKALRRFEAWAP
jgi:hypothetical protein